MAKKQIFQIRVKARLYYEVEAESASAAMLADLGDPFKTTESEKIIIGTGSFQAATTKPKTEKKPTKTEKKI